MKSIAILCGAGAEIDYGIGGGSDFATSVIGYNDNGITNTIVDYYNEMIEKHDANKWYPKCKKQNNYSNIKDIIQASIRKGLLENDINGFDTKNSFEKLVDYFTNQTMDRIVNKKTETFLTDKDFIFFEENRDSIKFIETLVFENSINPFQIIENYPSYMGVIDSKFFTIINPKILGSDSFWYVVLCYTRAYIKIVTDIFKTAKLEYNLIDLLVNKKETAHKLNCAIDKIVLEHKQNTYYSIIKDCSKRININLITTNYTSLIKKATTIKNISYIHGKTSWFEDPYNLKVLESVEADDAITFPYMFLQSAIKPIVDTKQLNEYSKMLNFLNKSDVIIILGFRFNSDDNHITSIVSECLDKKKVIYLDYVADDYLFDGDNDIDYISLKDAKINEIKRKLHVRINNETNLEHIFINKNNCYTVFQDLLKNI